MTNWLTEIRSQHDSTKKSELARDFASQEKFLMRKAYWCYCSVLPPPDQIHFERFQEDQINAISEFYLSAEKTSLRTNDIGSPDRPMAKQLFFSWHYPRFPEFLFSLSEYGCVVLLADMPPWLNFPKEHCILFRNGARETRMLIKALNAGAPIFCMLDYCYDGTRSVESDFLGQRCKTPSGIVELALRYSYSINFIPANVSISDANFESVALESKVGNVINAMNKCIEQDLLKNPTSWLLWPSLDRRWVNYR